MKYDFSKEQVLQAITGSYGIMSQVARVLGGCDWSTAQRYVNKWAETRQAYQDEGERALDHTEGKMLEAIKNGDGRMIRFHLSTKGKKRGYVQGVEVGGPDGESITKGLTDAASTFDSAISRILADRRARGDTGSTGEG